MVRFRLNVILLVSAALLIEEADAFVSSPQKAQYGKSQSHRTTTRALKMVQSLTIKTSSSADLERQIVTLGRRGQTDEAISLYQSVSRPSIRLLNGAIDACARARPTRLNQAFELLEEGIQSKELTPNVFTFGALVSACSRARQSGRAIELLRAMENDYNVKPNAVVYSTVISACSREARAEPSQYKTALKLLSEVEEKNIDMSVVGYNAALSACSFAGEWEAAIALFDRMKEKGIVDNVSYGTVMAACENGSQWNLVLKYAGTMCKDGLAFDGIAVTSALHACQQLGLGDEALRYLQIMKFSPMTSQRKTAGWQRKGSRGPLEGPDSVAYRLAISACARGGDWESGVRLLGEMREVTGDVDVVAYTAAITGCEYAGEWRRAFAVLEMMRQDGVDPNEVTMAAIIGACATACARGIDVESAFKKAIQLLAVMKKDPTVVDPNITVYNAAIRAAAEANRLDVAFSLVEAAENNGLKPTIVTFGTMMTACERASSLEAMDRVFQMMKEASIKPNEIVYGAVFSCLRKTYQAERAFLLLRKVIKDGLNPNTATFNTVLMAQTENRKFFLDNAIATYKMMATSDASKPNRQTYAILIKAFCSNLQPQGAEAFIRRMQEEGIKPDVDLYTMTVTAYEKTRQPLRAVRLMESMQEVGYDFYSVKVLNAAFKNAVKLVNVVGKSLSDNEIDGDATWNARIKNLNQSSDW